MATLAGPDPNWCAGQGPWPRPARDRARLAARRHALAHLARIEAGPRQPKWGAATASAVGLGSTLMLLFRPREVAHHPSVTCVVPHRRNVIAAGVRSDAVCLCSLSPQAPGLVAPV